MTLLANENFPGPSIRYLRDRGFEVLSVSEQFSGMSDLEIIVMAKVSNFTILTMDKDYGEMIFRDELPDPPPVVFFRYPENTPRDLLGKDFETMIASGVPLEGKFTVIDEKKWRQKPYPVD